VAPPVGLLDGETSAALSLPEISTRRPTYCPAFDLVAGSDSCASYATASCIAGATVVGFALNTAGHRDLLLGRGALLRSGRSRARRACAGTARLYSHQGPIVDEASLQFAVIGWLEF